MEQQYYKDMVRWDDLPRCVKDKPFEADFTMNMYDEPEGAEIPGVGFRVRILPEIYWETDRYDGSRAYLVESLAGWPRRFILTSTSERICTQLTPDDIGEEDFEAAASLAGSSELQV